MNYRRYGGMTGVSPETLGLAAGSGVLPLMFFRLQPEIERECDDLHNRGVRRLSPATVNDCVNRICTNARNKYPDLAGYVDEYEKNTPYTSYNFHSLGVDVQIFGLFAGLVALLFLSEFFGRRRFVRRARRFY